MSDFTRAWAAEFRLADSDARTIIGVAVPYNDPTPIYEHGRLFTETIQHGAFADSIAKRGNRIPILLHHDARALPIGKPTALRDTADALIVEARISRTAAGDDALELVRDGVLDGLSIGFSVPTGGDVWSADGGQRQIERARLHEVSLVNFPAYDNARVTAVRAAADVPIEADQPAPALHIYRLQLLRRELAAKF